MPRPKGKGKNATKVLEWIRPPLPRQADDGATYYGGVEIGGDAGASVFVGNVVLMRSPDTFNPYIALIDSFYQNKAGEKLCKATWFYR
jgi:hypothetical protein